MKSIRNWGRVLLMAVTALVLVACGSKPPECAETAATDALRKFMNDSIVEALPAKGVKPAEDSKGLIAKYLGTWSFNLSNVTTSGYDEKSRTRSCAGKVTISIPDTQQTGYVDVQYDMQSLEGAKSGEFQLRASRNYQTWAYGAMEPVANHYKVYSVAGTWVGKSTCDATEVKQNLFATFPTTEAERGFTVVATEIPWQPDEAAKAVPVRIVIADGQVSLEISVESGKIVARTGRLHPGGRFKTGTDDPMKSAVVEAGYLASDGMIHASGNVITTGARVKSNATGNELDGVLVRRCSLDLAKQ